MARATRSCASWRRLRELHDELTPHLVNKEEQAFPALRRLAVSATAAEDLQRALHALEDGHDRAGCGARPPNAVSAEGSASETRP